MKNTGSLNCVGFIVFTAGLIIGCSSESKVDNGDMDSDSVVNDEDNCVDLPNPQQEDGNRNHIGDVCEIRDFAPSYKVLHYDADNAAPGETLFTVVNSNGAFASTGLVTLGYLAAVPLSPGTDGDNTLDPIWEYASFDTGEFLIANVLSNGHLMAIRGKDGGDKLVEIDPVSAKVVNRYASKKFNHDFIALPDGNFLVIYTRSVDSKDGSLYVENVAVIDPDGTQLWDWDLYDRVPDAPASEKYVSLAGIWSNCNALDFAPDEDWKDGQPLSGNIYLNCRIHNRLYNIEYPSGEIVWIMGDDGDFGEGMFHHPHDTQIAFDTDDTGKRTGFRVLMYDNREAPFLGDANACPPDEPEETCPDNTAPYSRVIEVAVDNDLNAQIVWKWPSPTSPDFDQYRGYAPIGGGVSRLSNGNLLITNATVGGNPFLGDEIHARLIELKRDGTLTGATVVWDVEFNTGYGSFKAIRLPEGTTANWTSDPFDLNDFSPSSQK